MNDVTTINDAIQNRLDASHASSIAWPRKHDLFGVDVSATTYDEATAAILTAAREGISSVVSAHAAHAVVCASDDPALRAKVNSFQIVTPDGQPVRWALNALHGAGLNDRVRGTELMLRVCRAAAGAGVSIYLYGGTDEVLSALRGNLATMCPGVVIAGAFPPPFRPLTAVEQDDVVHRIIESGAGIVFIGLGCPKQDHFAYELLGRVPAVSICVGAAFDFHAGIKTTAPLWMQHAGLEWVHRLCSEPGRLWRRYLETNTRFVLKFARAWWQKKTGSAD